MNESNLTSEGNGEPGRRNWLSFGALLAVQGQNAFNDNAIRWLLAVLGAAVAASAAVEAGGDPTVGYYENVLGVLFVLPFILFSPFAGWLADRFSKKQVIVGAMAFQIVVFLVIGLGVSQRSLTVATFAFFLLALQSTLMSPAKNGILKEYVGRQRLGFANGWIQFVLILSILAGSIIGPRWFDKRFELSGDPFTAGMFPVWIFAAATIIPLVLCLGMGGTRARNPGKPFSVRLFYSHFGELLILFRDRKLRLSAIGVSWFWMFAAVAQLIAFGAAREITGGQSGMGTETAFMMASASIGIAAGSAFAAILGAKRLRLGLVPLGALGMAVACLVISLLEPGKLPFYVMLGMVGVTSAVFYVPIFAYLQQIAPEDRRGRILAATNVMSNIGMVLAVAAQAGVTAMGADTGMQFLILGMLSLVGGFYVVRVLPQDFFRALILPVVRVLYRVRVTGGDKVPKEGGLLLVSNHVSYIDAFLLGAACPRPVRFVVAEEYYRRWWAHWFLKIFGAVSITPSKAKDAIRQTADALKQGHVVCIFPEGKLTRTGEVLEFQKGFELILRQAKVRLQPACIDGAWGSIFSHYGGRLIWSLPRRFFAPVVIRFGDPMEVGEVDSESVRDVVIRLLETEEEGRPVYWDSVPKIGE